MALKSFGTVGSPALSPDDRRLVYVAERDGTQQLYLREIASAEAAPIPGTEGAAQPLFSPDGQWVVFLAEQKLKKVSLSGGPPVPFADTGQHVLGACWGPDDSIVFGDHATGGIRRVSLDGGTSQPLTTPHHPLGTTSHGYPQMLPGGDALLFVALGGGCGNPRIVVQSLATGEQRTLVEGGTAPHFLPPGHIVYAKAATLLAAPFDLERLELTGASIPLVDGVKMGGCGRAREEVHVTSFPRPTRKWTISTEGGTAPAWARSGLELFYLQGEWMMAVAFLTEPDFTPLKPKPLFVGSDANSGPYGRHYDVALDGRFVMLKAWKKRRPRRWTSASIGSRS